LGLAGRILSVKTNSEGCVLSPYDFAAESRAKELTGREEKSRFAALATVGTISQGHRDIHS
jgi:hypothetical protein